VSDAQTWRRCSACKEPIALGAQYYTCNVSTCNRKRTGLFFCSVSCWDAHLPIMRHREAWAEEQRSPTREAWAREQQSPSRPAAKGSATASPEKPGPSNTGSRREGRRRLVRPQARGEAHAAEDDVPREILIVASKLKAYVRARSGMNTSDSVMAALSERVRALCDDAIREARKAERKTIMDRDFPEPRR